MRANGKEEEAIEVRHCRNQAEAITKTQKATHQIFNMTRPMGHRRLRLAELWARSGPGYKLHETPDPNRCTQTILGKRLLPLSFKSRQPFTGGILTPSEPL
jgi:hypothetical protein